MELVYCEKWIGLIYTPNLKGQGRGDYSSIFRTRCLFTHLLPPSVFNHLGLILKKFLLKKVFVD